MLKNIIYYIKDFFDRCLFFYKNDWLYKKFCVQIFFIFIIFNVICVCIYCFYDEQIFLFQFLISLSIFFLRIVESRNIVPTAYIKPNIDKLPNKVGKSSVIVQYALPKWLSPSEVWLIYNLKSYQTNFDCLLYKRESEWLIKIELRNDWYLSLYRIMDIGENVPGYEKQYRLMIFWENYREKVVWSMKPSIWGSTMNSWTLDSDLLYCCVKKWWLSEEINYLFFVAIFWIIVCWIFFRDIYWLVVGLLCVTYIVLCAFKRWLSYIWKIIWRTDKWIEVYAHILGYKYFLEKCEEKQIQEILGKDNEFKSKNMSYVYALRMNWKFLDKSFNK